ncbi:MAG TPA: hypothetical protein PKO25_04360 [Spirochaetota bacterium]|nr:hypothetical protein [Spirochaetota bacterium]HNU91082.1 hypothetical protein [Spirochaetota bacterium]HPV96829.1 hypothetical protein [Spirochaetota bacterium]
MTPDDAQMTALGEQAKLFNIAIKHTGGDMEKARLMVAGQYEDVAVIKGKFSLPAMGKYGVFLIFLNIVTRRLANVNSLVLSDAGFTERTRIFDAWRLFNSDFRSAARSAGDASSGSYEFSAHLADSLDGYDIYTPIDAWDLDAASDIVSEIIEKFYRGESPQCQIELEKTSSLAMELEGVQIEGKGEVEGAAGGDERLAEIERQAQYVVPGRVIVSPVRGKYINDVRPGDTIRVLLTAKDAISVKVSKLLNAYTEEGEFLPIKGRVKEKIAQGKFGYIIYALVAKNVMAKIIEEENVKIEMEGGSPESTSDKGDSRLVLYLSLLLGLVVLTLIIIFSLI